MLPQIAFKVPLSRQAGLRGPLEAGKAYSTLKRTMKAIEGAILAPCWHQQRGGAAEFRAYLPSIHRSLLAPPASFSIHRPFAWEAIKD